MMQRSLQLGVALTLALSLSACRDDLQTRESSGDSTSAPLTPTEEYIGKVGFALEADVEVASDQSARAAMDFYLMDREKKITEVDGKSRPSADYADELAPRMFLEEGKTVSGALVFIRDDGSAAPKVYRHFVNFDVIEGVKKADGSYDPKAKNRIRYIGEINFSETDSLELDKEITLAGNAEASAAIRSRVPARNTTKESRWRVMAILGYNDGRIYRTQDGTDEINRLNYGRSMQDNFITDGNPSIGYAYHLGQTQQVNVPCISQWATVYVTQAPYAASTPVAQRPRVTGFNYDLHFKPQGVLLQYDLSSLDYDTQDIRRIGVVSNVLDFKGYYDLNSTAVRAGYADFKAGKGAGIPAFIPNTPDMNSEEFALNYTPSADNPLTGGARVYPWDMPTLSSNKSTHRIQNWPQPTTAQWKLPNASISDFLPLGENSPGEHSVQNYPWLNGKIQRLWSFLRFGGMIRSGGRMERV